MENGLQIILSVFRQAWAGLTIFMVSAAALAMLAQVLRTIGASALGASLWVYESLASIGAVLILVLVAFLGIPPVVKALSGSVPGSPGCGPISELGMFASGLIAALVSLRMLLSFARTMAGAALGGTAEISHSMLEAVEAMFGMLLAGVVIPLTAMFIGVCK
jgi:hypothetical protein